MLQLQELKLQSCTAFREPGPRTQNHPKPFPCSALRTSSLRLDDVFWVEDVCSWLDSARCISLLGAL